ncbi:putative GCY1-galactose-induced protein of aldo/keto reductase family [Piptocephalis cylindrospora]|uniref:Putative GCY1-galactose-induced protein of aldo/keto reductase family n=1 Tax=Piptocephalis cylindrospora TaxID=1907219 RepID=A0A4P9XYK8_9FUNG|nr:putative GCY1-galactose-induced protein of aldo/keto reductase family [Piptocephalis cylindrospora]|eukprot:RKP11515.1 putative GCY1-galactose-induced protein of aldo/keto reductase family [Piptocephalis cylindrospora]
MANLGQKTFTLNTGAQIPAVGLGTFDSTDQEELSRAIHCALGAGYRHVDCAAYYANEREIGQAIRTYSPAIPRDKLFITSKLWNDKHRPVDVLPALEQSLKYLQVDYLDLYLMHWPVALTKEGLTQQDARGWHIRDEGVTFLDTWQAMEALLDTGKVKAIGVSNFDIPHLQRLLSHCKVRPAVNQVELHPLLPQAELLEFCAKEDIHLSAYCPIGSGKAVLDHPVIEDIARRTKRSPAQVVLAWAIERGTSVLPKSVTPARIESNIDLAPLSQEYVQELDAKKGGRGGGLTKYSPSSSVLGYT